MTQTNKEQIQEQLRKYVASYPSQNAAANSLTGVSSATLSQILNNKWELIADSMWRKIMKQIGGIGNWQLAETHTSKMLRMLIQDAQRNAHTHAAVIEAGRGKSQTASDYALQHSNAYVVSCAEYFNRKTFLGEVLRAMGKENGGTVAEMMDSIVNYMEQAEEPVLILDEADKLNDQVLAFFITLYNRLEDKCGLVLMATNFLQKRIERGVRLCKKGYNEIYSRIGRRFFNVVLNNEQLQKDISLVCIANGIDNKEQIMKIVNESEGDFRRVKKLVYKYNNSHE